MEDRKLDSHDMRSAHRNVSDLVVTNNPGEWVVVCKASSENQGFMKSTKRMALEAGWLYQVSTMQKNIDGTWSIAEALTFVPYVMPS